jgi:hypothetical protein
VHYFWLLEFKIKFEFFWFETLCQNPKTFFHFPLTPFLPSKPNPAKGLRSSPLAHRPKPASSRPPHPPRVPARLAFRPSRPANRRSRSPPPPLRLTRGPQRSSPTPARLPPGLRAAAARVRLGHAFPC